MAQCITCGTALHPERAQKYSYCMARECQEKNATGLTMVAVGMNKAADEFLILDERTREDLASGKYRDQRRGSFGPAAPAPGPRAASGGGMSRRRADHPAQPQPQGRSAAPAPARRPWTRRQEKLSLIYNEQGLRPAEIARKLGLSAYTVTQIILAARNRAKG
jgi:DNA-binding CsgD family transcriptional regulator